MNIRPLTPSDCEAAAALVRQAFETLSAPVDPPPSARRETGANLASILAAGGGGACVEEAGALIGVVVWQTKERGLYFGRLSVAAAARGRGIAKALIAAAEAEARWRGLPRLLLSTRLPLVDNRRLFASVGFTEVAYHAHEGYSEKTFVDMEKELG